MMRLVIGLVGPFPPPFGGMAVYFATLADRLEHEGVLCRRIAIPSGSMAVRLGGFLRASRRILRSDACVVHCVTGSQANLLANVLPLTVARAVRKPSVLSVVGGEFHGAVTSGSAIRRLILRHAFSPCDYVIACNQEIAEALGLLGISRRRVVVLTNALPVREDPDPGSSETGRAFAEFAAAHTPVILSVSGWYEHYGSMDILRAVATLRQRHLGLGLVLVVKAGGDRGFAQSVRAWIRDNGLSDHVLLLENVPSVTAIMGRSDVFVRTPHVEGDSISVREALAVGLPVVASDAGLRPPGVVLYRPADASDLARKVEQALGSPRGVGSAGPADEGKANFERLVAIYQELARIG